MPQGNLLTIQGVGFREARGRFAAAETGLVEGLNVGAAELSLQVLDLYRRMAPYNPERPDPHFRDTLGLEMTPSSRGFSGAITTSRPDIVSFMRTGTGIYGPRGLPIVPRTARALRWVYGGRVFFARSVRGMVPMGEWETVAQQAARPLAAAMMAKLGARISGYFA